MAEVRIITEPAVYLLGRQTVDDAELDRFLRDHEVAWETDSEVAAEVLCEVGGRTCYMSFAKPRPGGKESGHGSVLEHAVWNFLITGVSRSLSHELIRHRVGAGYSQLSQRYVDESVAEYVEPDIIAADPELHRLWAGAVEHAHAAYVKLVERLQEKIDAECRVETGCYHPNCAAGWQKDKLAEKVFVVCPQCKGSEKRMTWAENAPSTTDRRKLARQAARSVLPNATETKIFLTINARAARNVIEQRGSRHAEPEIRKLAGKLLAVLVREAPALFSDYRRLPLPDGTDELTTEYRKV
jgi:thymidylate synthase (FAD)